MHLLSISQINGLLAAGLASVLPISLELSLSFASDLCWRHSYGRGAGTIPAGCSGGMNNQNGLCYRNCAAGYHGEGPVCWQNCPSGFTDIGVSCAKPKPYGRGAGYPWKFGDPLDDSRMFARCQAAHGRGNCEKSGAVVYPKCKPGFHPVGCCTCSPNCVNGMRDDGAFCAKKSYGRGAGIIPTGCGQKVNDAGLCYPRCTSGYAGVGPVCWGQCPATHPVNCGAGCATSSDACAGNVTDQVTSVLDTTLTIVEVATTGGAMTAARKAAQTGAKVAIKTAIKKASANLRNLTKSQIKQQLQKMAREQGKELAQSQAELWATALATGEDFDPADLDPTGIAAIVKAYNKPVCQAPRG